MMTDSVALFLALVTSAWTFLAIGCIILYILPSIVAFIRKHTNKGIILLLNVLMGWTCLGWVCCLIWAFIDKDGKEIIDSFKNIGRKQI